MRAGDAAGPVRRVRVQLLQGAGDPGSSAGGTSVPKPVCTTGWRTPGMSLDSTGTPASIATACTIPNASKAFTDGKVNTSSEA